MRRPWLLSGRRAVVHLMVLAVLAAGLSARSYESAGSVLSNKEAASIRGGACGTFKLLAQGACTTNAPNTCTLQFIAISFCTGSCAFNCAPTAMYVNGQNFTGSLAGAGNCAAVVQPACTLVHVWTLPFALTPTCQCINGVNTPCGGAPNTLVPGCAG